MSYLLTRIPRFAPSVALRNSRLLCYSSQLRTPKLNMSGTEEFQYFTLTMEDYKEAFDFVSKHFLARVPLTVAAKESQSPVLRRDMEEDVKACIASGVSFSMIHKPTTQLVGVKLNRIITPSKTSKASTKEMSVTYSVLGKLAEGINYVQDLEVQRVLDIYLVVIRPDFGGRNLVVKLIEKTLELGVENDCQIANVLITNPITERIYTRLGFQTIKSYDMNDNPDLDTSLVSAEAAVLHFMTKRLPSKPKKF